MKLSKVISLEQAFLAPMQHLVPHPAHGPCGRLITLLAQSASTGSRTQTSAPEAFIHLLNNMLDGQYLPTKRKEIPVVREVALFKEIERDRETDRHTHNTHRSLDEI